MKEENEIILELKLTQKKDRTLIKHNISGQGAHDDFRRLILNTISVLMDLYKNKEILAIVKNGDHFDQKRNK